MAFKWPHVRQRRSWCRGSNVTATNHPPTPSPTPHAPASAQFGHISLRQYIKNKPIKDDIQIARNLFLSFFSVSDQGFGPDVFRSLPTRLIVDGRGLKHTVKCIVDENKI